jgi:hypothetical protein
MQKNLIRNQIFALGKRMFLKSFGCRYERKMSRKTWQTTRTQSRRYYV